MTFRSVCIGLVLSMLLCLGSTPRVAAISLEFAPVDNSAVLTGYKTYDMLVTTETDWTSAAMVLGLDAGSIYQHGYGTDSGPPQPAFVSLFPDLAFDTYVVGSAAGGAGDVGGGGYVFGSSELDVSWYNIAQTDIGATTIGRLTLTEDAAGSLSIFLTTGDYQKARYDTVITPGAAPQVTLVLEEEPASVNWESPSLPVYEPPTDWPTTAFPGNILLGQDLSTYAYPFVVPRSGGSVTWDSRADLYGYGESTLVKLKDTRLLSDRHARATLNNFFVSPDGDPVADSGLPEPATLTLIGLGMGGALLRRR